MKSKMEVLPQRPKRCIVCNKIIRCYNKSGYCSSCANKKSKEYKKYITTNELNDTKRQKPKHLNTNYS